MINAVATSKLDIKGSVLFYGYNRVVQGSQDRNLEAEAEAEAMEQRCLLAYSCG